MGTAGDSVFINGIILIFKSRSCVQRDIGFGEMFVITKSVTSKKILIEFYGIKSSIAKECFRIDQRMSGKEVLECLNQKF